MADTFRRLRVELVAGTSDFERAFQRASKLTKGISKELGGLGRNLKAVGGEMQSAGRALTVGISGPLAALGGLAAKFAIDFESAFAGVKKTVEATPEEFEKLAQGFRDLSKEIPTAATDLARIGEAGGQLGIAKENLLDFTRVVADMAEATNLTADEAATAFARIANITGLPQTEFSNLGSSIVDLGNNMAATESEIVEMTLRLSAAGRAAGISVPDITALGASLASVGLEAQAGGTALSKIIRQMITAVAQGGTELETFAAIAGQTSAEFAKAFEDDATGALQGFLKGLEGLGGAGALQALDALGISEVRTTDTALRLASAHEKVAEAVEISAGAFDENRALSEEAEKRYETTASKLSILKNQFVDIGTSIGEALGPAIDALISAGEGAAKSLEGLVKRFKELPEPVQVAAGFAALAAIISGPLVYALGSLATGLGSIIRLFGLLSSTRAATTLTAFATEAGSVGGAVAKIGNAVPVLTARLALLEGGLGTAATSSGLLAGGAVALGAAIGVGLGTAINKAGREASLFSDHIVEGTAKVGLLEGAVSLLPDVLSSLWEGLKSVGRGLLDALGPVGELLSFIGGKLGELASFVSGYVVQAFDSLARKIFPVVESAAALDAEARDLAAASAIAGREVTDWGEAQRILGAAIKENQAALGGATTATREATQAAGDNADEESRRAEELKKTTEALAAKKKAEKEAAAEAERAAKRFKALLDELSGKRAQKEADELARAIKRLGVEGVADLEALRAKLQQLNEQGAELGPGLTSILRGGKIEIPDLDVSGLNLDIPKDDVKELTDLFTVTGLEAQTQFDAIAAAGKSAGVPIDAIKAALDNAGASADQTRVALTNVGGGFSDEISDALGDLPKIILQAIQGGGDVGRSVGAAIGGSIGQALGGSLGKKAGDAIGGKLGSVVGGAIGSVVPVVGTLLGGLVGDFIGKGIGKLFNDPIKEVNDLRDAFFEAEGGFEEFSKKMAAVSDEDFAKKIFDAKSVEEFNAVVAEAKGLLDTQGQAQEALREATERYGFSLEELGPAMQRQELDKQAGQLLQDFRLLTASGIDVNTVIAKMGPNLLDFVNQSRAAGQAVPEAMRPMIDELIKSGQLVDENGNAFESAEAAGISFSETMSEQFSKLIDRIDQFVSAITGIKPEPIQIPINYDVGNSPNLPPGANIPGGRIPELAAGGIVRMPTLAVVGEAGPEAVVPLDAFASLIAGGGDGGGDQTNLNLNVAMNPLQTHETVEQTVRYLTDRVQSVLAGNLADLVAEGKA